MSTSSIAHATVPVDQLLAPCVNEDELHAWLLKYLQVNVPRNPICPGHCAPFEYVRRAYFEPAQDLVVWAPRGGGKTRLAAAATLLDLLHKQGVAVRILGGSLDQSLRMWEHLLPDLLRLVPDLLVGKPGAARKVLLTNQSSAAVLTQSQRAVRGLRVQKLRCDEVDLFKPAVWDAAQLVTRSRDGASGAIEALSTMHTPLGLMSQIADHARRTRIPVIRWCLLEVLERCPTERSCTGCPLWDDCRGVAKQKCDGFVRIDDAIVMMNRVSRETWEAEMLCRRPSTRGCVFPSFDDELHVSERQAGCDLESGGELSLAIDFGFAAPFVCLWVIAEAGIDGITRVIDEYVQPGRTVEEHVEQIQQRPWGEPRYLACDPAGAARNEQTAASNLQILRSHGLAVRRKRSRINDGIEMIRTALRPATGPPRLFIHPRCVRLIRALQCYRYAPGGSEVPVKDGEHDHLVDALRYHFVNRSALMTQDRPY
jgi:hypothetical protein